MWRRGRKVRTRRRITLREYGFRALAEGAPGVDKRGLLKTVCWRVDEHVGYLGLHGRSVSYPLYSVKISFNIVLGFEIESSMFVFRST